MSEQRNKAGGGQAGSQPSLVNFGGGCSHIWDQVFSTDPQYTKDFTKKGGFSGTAITPTYLAMKATKVFGPMGIGWGVKILQEDFLEGAPMGWDANGNFYGNERIHRLKVQFWYKIKIDGQLERGEIEHFGQTTFVGKTRDGIFTDEEAPKKSLTDAMTKCMSLLGFGADVHMNLFSDVKYLEGLQTMYGGGGDENRPTGAPVGTQGSGSSPGNQQQNEHGQGQKTMSDRYNGYKQRLDNEGQPLADVAIARQTIEQDGELSKLEKGLLLSHKRLVLPAQQSQQQPEIFL